MSASSLGTTLHPLARAWMAGLRHKARHKFLPEEVSAKSRPVPLFLQIGGHPRHGIENLEIGKPGSIMIDLRKSRPTVRILIAAMANSGCSLEIEYLDFLRCTNFSGTQPGVHV